MKKLRDVIAESLVGQVITEIVTIPFTFLIIPFLKGEGIEMSAVEIELAIIGALIGLVIILFCKISLMAERNVERTNYFHWMYNYRFSKLKALNADFKCSDKEEFEFMVNKVSEKYHEKTRQEVLKMLEPHYEMATEVLKQIKTVK